MRAAASTSMMMIYLSNRAQGDIQLSTVVIVFGVLILFATTVVTNKRDEDNRRKAHQRAREASRDRSLDWERHREGKRKDEKYT